MPQEGLGGLVAALNDVGRLMLVAIPFRKPAFSQKLCNGHSVVCDASALIPLNMKLGRSYRLIRHRLTQSLSRRSRDDPIVPTVEKPNAVFHANSRDHRLSPPRAPGE